MIGVDYNRRAYTTRGLTRGVSKWPLARPPTTFWEETQLSYRAAKNTGLWGGMWDKLDRSSGVEELYQDDFTLREKLTPEQIAIEFPDTVMPIKTPKTRGEMQLINERDFKEKSLMQALAGKNMSFLPDILPNLAGSLGAGLTDPFSWVIGLATWGVLPAAPALRTLYTTANLAKSAMAARGAAAGILAIDGLVGGATYSLSNYLLQKSNYRPYEVGDIIVESIASAGLGSLLGFGLPGAANLKGKLFLPRKYLPQFVTNLGIVASMLRNKKMKNAFWNYMGDESGAINLKGLVDILSGKKCKRKEGFSGCSTKDGTGQYSRKRCGFYRRVYRAGIKRFQSRCLCL